MEQNQAELIEELRAHLNPISTKKENLDHLKPAAVLIPLFLEDEKWKLLFIRRSNFGEFHRGEVAFPGGAKEANDTTLAATALRETYEELGIPSEHIQILGSMQALSTVSNYIVTPIIGVLKWPVTLTRNPAEVARVFSIPVNWLANRTNWSVKEFELVNRGRISTVVFETYDDEVLWGFSAKVTLNFLQFMQKEER